MNGWRNECMTYFMEGINFKNCFSVFIFSMYKGRNVKTIAFLSNNLSNNSKNNFTIHK